jgi:ribonuclease BN (tRNA processing enzyme)
VKVTVLGGSAAGVNTGAGSSGYLVETGRSTIVLDLGPGTLPELRVQTDFRTLDAIVISHLHLDHILDLAALRFALAYNPVPAIERIPLWLPPHGLETLIRIAAAFSTGDPAEFFSEVFDVRIYDPSRTLEINDTTIWFQPTVHYIPCWAMRLQTAQGASLGYTADTGPAAPLAPFFDGVEVLIAEGTNLEPGEEPFLSRGHLTAGEAGALAEEIGAETLILSHLWEERGFENYRLQARETFSRNLIVARRGVSHSWQSRPR